MNHLIHAAIAVLICGLTLGFTAPSERWEAMPAATPFNGMMSSVLTGTLTGTLTETLTVTCDGADNFDWSFVPSALVPNDTTVLAVGEMSEAELVLNLNNVVINPATSEAEALLALTISSVSGLPDGLTADYPTDAIPSLSYECIPLTGEPSEAGLYELILSCTAEVFAEAQTELLEGVEFSHWIRVLGPDDTEGVEGVEAHEQSIVLYPNPTKTREMQLAGMPGDQAWTATLHSLSGKIVRNYNGTGETRLDMTNVPSGMYVLQYAPARGRVQVQRVMIQ